jgi:hypothetical protein
MVTACQPMLPASLARSGRKTSWPLAVLAARMPMARPRLVLNHRLTMVAPSTMATTPTPMPTITPQSSMSCQAWVIRVLAATLRATSAIAMKIERRMPRLCISAAANGPIRP